MSDQVQGTTDLEIQEIDTNTIKFFVRRSRATGAYSRLKQSIKEIGLHQPIHVRDVSHWPPSERRRPDGQLYTYELICGQGRLQAFRELGIERIPALVIKVGEGEIVGRFLAENVMRKNLGWYEKAELIKRDVEAQMSIEDIKQKYFITSNHVYKYLRILKQASPKLVKDAEIEKLSMNEAEALTGLAPNDQEIVVEVLREEGLPQSQIPTLVKKTRQLRAAGSVSKDTLKSSVRNLQKSLTETRKIINLKRFHWDLGPGNLLKLLAIPEFRIALEQQRVTFADFERAVSQSNVGAVEGSALVEAQ
jgi:ParB/RepB/Spo0J family partition protein